MSSVRRRVRRPWLPLLVPALLALRPAWAAVPAAPLAPATVVLLVRHAEKAPGAGDVPLSAEGEARARALVEVGRVAGVQAIITTQYARTRSTGAPLAAALHLTPEIIPAQADVPSHAAAVSEAIRRNHQGRTVLVVGHSNTIPPIVAALGGERFRDLCDPEYDALFVVVLSDAGPVRTVKSRFGAPTPLGAECTSMR